MAGIPTPTLFYVDQEKNALIMEHFVHAITVRDFILSHPKWEESRDVRELAINIGAMLAKLHKENIIHGDLTTSNM
jgi:TP53 regulating kinase-like protein